MPGSLPLEPGVVVVIATVWVQGELPMIVSAEW